MRTFAVRALKRAGREVRVLLPVADRRRFQLYCVSAGKSGTHSVAAMFGRNFRAAHEPDAYKLIDVMLSGSTDGDRVRRFLYRRDRRRMLEVDSSQLNWFFLEILVDLFPAAKFLLTIRSPFEWLDSTINHELGRAIDHRWRALQDFRMRSDRSQYPAEEALLRQKGLYPLDAYLAYWSRHNRAVLAHVPAERLLIVRTEQIGARAREIADFAGVSASQLDTSKSHSYQAELKFDVLHAIDRGYLEAKVDQHCGDLVDQFFPELRARAGRRTRNRQPLDSTPTGAKLASARVPRA